MRRWRSDIGQLGRKKNEAAPTALSGGLLIFRMDKGLQQPREEIVALVVD
jgi:hypothetical protein